MNQYAHVAYHQLFQLKHNDALLSIFIGRNIITWIKEVKMIMDKLDLPSFLSFLFRALKSGGSRECESLLPTPLNHAQFIKP